MEIRPVTLSPGVASVTSAARASLVPVGSTSNSTSDPRSSSPTTTISPWGDALNKLQQLQQSDPAAFGRAVDKLAQTATDSAGTAPAQDQADLKKLADALTHVAKTGDLSALGPPKHLAHHHHVTKEAVGGTGTMLSTMLQQLDLLIGPNATPTTAGPLGS
jgi:hypothetical protein